MSGENTVFIVENMSIEFYRLKKKLLFFRIL